MTLRAKIFTVILAFTFIPILFTTAVLFFNKRVDLHNERNYQRFWVSRWISNDFFPSFYKENLENLEVPEALEVCLIDDKGVIVFSNIELLTIGNDIAEVVSEFYESRQGTDYNSVTESFSFNNSKWHLFIMYQDLRSHLTKHMYYPVKRIFELVLFIIGCGMILGSIFVGSILRSVNSLKSAAEKITSGDLDFQLKAEGSDELSVLVASFEEMRHTLKETQEGRARFLMAISHDLKTPLTSIKGYLEALNDGMATDTETYQKYLSIILNKTNVLEERISDLISFAAMERGEWILKTRSVHLRSFLDSLSVVYKEDCELMNKKFIYKNEIPDSCMITADPVLFERALENHFTNSIRYTFDGAIIMLNCYLENDIPVVEIADNGSGMDEKDLKNIFEPFYRGTASRREPGMGLGLSTSKSIFESHGWSVSVKSEKEKGTIFKIILGSLPQ